MKFTTKIEKLPIWGEIIPGNTGKSKSDVMHIDKTMTMQDVFTKYPGIWDKSTLELGDLKGNDFMVWQDEMVNGYAGETYDDVPFLVPYLVEGSDKCVISCPGGAYLSKSVVGEGEDIAKFLNAAGISCFVLWYRTYPYRAPLMYLDCQRAIRYVRYHAKEYGIDPNKIATVGYSAGGNLTGVEAFCFRNEPVEWPGYTPDEVDQVDGNPSALGQIYSATTLSRDGHKDKIVAVMAGPEVYQDDAKCTAFAAQYEMITHVREGDCPVFLCAALDDDIVPPLANLDLARALREKNVPVELHLFPYGGHGFGGCVEYPLPEGLPIAPADYSSCIQWKDLFVNWLKHTLG